MTVSVAYGATISFIGHITSRYSKRGVVFFGLVIQNVGINVTGFDNRGDWKLTVGFTLLGLVLFGVGTAMVTIPIMPEILEAIEEHPKHRDGFNELVMQNNVAGYFIVCQAVGETCGPLTSSFLKLHYRFRPAQQFLGIIVSVFLILYILFCGVKSFFMNVKRGSGQRALEFLI